MNKTKFTVVTNTPIFGDRPVTGGTGTTREKIGTRRAQVEVTINLDKLQGLAMSAAMRDSGKATAFHGALVARRKMHEDKMEPMEEQHG